MIVRIAGAADLARVLPLLTADPAGYLTPELFLARLGSQEYRPEWVWLAEEGPGPARAVAVWWGSPGQPRPAALDGLYAAATMPDAERAEVAAGLLAAGHRSFAASGAAKPPDYHVFLPADWAERPDVLAALAWRVDAARSAGLTCRLERLRYEWNPSAGLPRPRACADVLRFLAEPDDEVFVGLFRRVLTGTLDATSGTAARALGADAQARQDVAFYRDQMRGDRAWWRVAVAPDGELAGFGIPSRNTEHYVVGYLGVVPERRGNGYADQILAEVTTILAVQAGATVIRADTDLANQPMAAAFERAGYLNTGRRLVLSAP